MGIRIPNIGRAVQRIMPQLKAISATALPDRATILPFVSMDAYGKPTYGDAIEIACRIQSYNRMVRDSTGQERIASTKTTIMPRSDINEKAKLILPDGSAPVILRIDGLIQSELTIVQVIYT